LHGEWHCAIDMAARDFISVELDVFVQLGAKTDAVVSDVRSYLTKMIALLVRWTVLPRNVEPPCCSFSTDEGDTQRPWTQEQTVMGYDYDSEGGTIESLSCVPS